MSRATMDWLEEADMTSEARERRLETALERRIREGKADPISPYERVLAARVRLAVDKRLGRPSEEWVKRLAKGA